MSSRSSDEIDQRKTNSQAGHLTLNLHTHNLTPNNVNAPSLALSSISAGNSPLPHSTNPALDPSLALPIAPEALFKHVRQMKIAARIRHRSSSLSSPNPPSISIHSRAGSNASSTYDDLLSSNLAHSSSTLSTCSNDGHTTLNVTQPSLNLTIPESHLDRSKNLTETLDLSHQRIADLTQPVVEELSEYVERLALGYNYLPVLPDHFAILGESLRYLNLRGNHMEIFPEVLTRMPSLEILDVSRNKIKAFPRRPGTLDRLRVLSVSRNRIKRLPNYIANLTVLRVLKIDHNPVVWPPKELVTFVDATDKLDEDDVDPTMRSRDDSSTHTRTRTPSNETITSMVQWLRTLQEWMRKNPYVRPLKQARPSTGETVGDPSEFAPSRSTEFERSFNSFKVTNSPDPTPVMTFSNVPAVPSPVPNQLVEPSADHVVLHNRNASSISSSQWVRKRPALRLKKSLPDLRRNHAEIMVERSGDVERSYLDLSRSPRFLPPHSGSSVTFSLNSPSLVDRGPRSAMSFSHGTPTSILDNPTNRSPPGHLSFRQNELYRSGGSQIRRMKIGTSGDDDTLAGVRNSGAYFRRLSMLPPSTISKQVPLPLLQLMDGIRGILFSLSQIDAALKQFVIFASQDRLPGALSRMTSAADESMSQLINALDRFDSSTRRVQPELEVVQQVLKSCRDNVIVFGKLVNVISIQLKVLTGAADVRYSRTLLLSLYGATAEIAMSWQTITPLVDDVISLPSLRQSKAPSQEPKDESRLPTDFPKESTTPTFNQQRTKSKENIQADQFTSSDSINQNFDHAKALPNTAGQVPSVTSLGSSTSSKSRRHAGSFIAEDVQLGASISPASAGLVNNMPPTPTLSTTSYSSFPFPSTSNDMNGLSMSASKPDSSSTSFLPDVTRPPPTNRHVSSRLNTSVDSYKKGPSSLSTTEHSKQTTSNDSLSVLISPVGLPRSPAFTSIATLTANNTNSPDTTLLPTADLTNHSKEASNEKFASIPPLTVNSNHWSSRSTDAPLRSASSPVRSFLPSSTIMVDIPERTTSRNYHAARFDSSLSRTDQDFLDMAEATIEIAVSVTSMMLENLGQATLFESTPTNNGVLSNNYNRNEAYGNASSTRRDHRKATITSSLTKAGELKELCEVETEVIRRLKVSLSNFWVARKAAISVAASNHNNHNSSNARHPSRDGYPSSINSNHSSFSSTSATTATTTTTTNEHHINLGSSSSFNNFSLGNSQPNSFEDLSAGLTNGIEAKKVFEDATAFVRAVIQTANLARATMTEYPLTKGIREGLGELTTATKELATLLAVSSFKPGPGTSNHQIPSSSPSNPVFSTSSQLSSSSLNSHNNNHCSNSNNSLLLTGNNLNSGISHSILQQSD